MPIRANRAICCEIIQLRNHKQHASATPHWGLHSVWLSMPDAAQGNINPAQIGFSADGWHDSGKHSNVDEQRFSKHAGGSWNKGHQTQIHALLIACSSIRSFFIRSYNTSHCASQPAPIHWVLTHRSFEATKPHTVHRNLHQYIGYLHIGHQGAH